MNELHALKKFYITSRKAKFCIKMSILASKMCACGGFIIPYFFNWLRCKLIKNFLCNITSDEKRESCCRWVWMFFSECSNLCPELHKFIIFVLWSFSALQIFCCFAISQQYNLLNHLKSSTKSRNNFSCTINSKICRDQNVNVRSRGVCSHTLF